MHALVQAVPTTLLPATPTGFDWTQLTFTGVPPPLLVEATINPGTADGAIEQRG